MWGIIGWDGVGSLRRVEGNLTGERYREEIIYDIDQLCTRRRNNRIEHLIFQQDNAREHAAIDTYLFLLEKHVQWLDWPAVSPDLNLFEHVWSDVARRVKDLLPARTQNDLGQQVLVTWQASPLDYIRSLFRFIYRRL